MLFFFVLHLVLLTGEGAEPVVLKNTEGNEITCTITRVEEESVTLVRDDGQAFEIPIEQLDDESKKIVEKVRIDLIKPVLTVELSRQGNLDALENIVNVPLNEIEFTDKEVFQVVITTKKPGEHRYILKYYVFDSHLMRRGRKVVFISPDKPFVKLLNASNKEQKIGAERYIYLKKKDIVGYRRPYNKECVIFLLDAETQEVVQEYATNTQCVGLIEDNKEELM